MSILGCGSQQHKGLFKTVVKVVALLDYCWAASDAALSSDNPQWSVALLMSACPLLFTLQQD